VSEGFGSFVLVFYFYFYILYFIFFGRKEMDREVTGMEERDKNGYSRLSLKVGGVLYCERQTATAISQRTENTATRDYPVYCKTDPAVCKRTKQCYLSCPDVGEVGDLQMDPPPRFLDFFLFIQESFIFNARLVTTHLSSVSPPAPPSAAARARTALAGFPSVSSPRMPPPPPVRSSAVSPSAPPCPSRAGPWRSV
jgi:hypothetical protein